MTANDEPTLKRYFVHYYVPRVAEVFATSIVAAASAAEAIVKAQAPGTRLHQILEDKPPEAA